jgi:hypothetical protein
MHELCIVVHDDSHGVHGEAVGLGHHALSEPVRDVVRAEEAGDDDEEVEGHERKGGDVPAAEDEALELEEAVLAAVEDGAGVARLGDGGLDEGGVVAAAAEGALDAGATVAAEVAGPHLVELALEGEGALLVGDVAGGDEEGEDDPEEEGEDGEEHAVVEEDAGPADEGGEDAEGGGDGGEDELGPVRDPEDVGMGPDVEPGEEAEDEGDERVAGQLRYRRQSMSSSSRRTEKGVN